jgi:hypothetical protein
VRSTIIDQLLQHHDQDSPTVLDWVVDSGASNHTTSDTSNLTSIRPPTFIDPSSIILGNGSTLPVISVGDSAFLSLFCLNNVLTTHDIIQNLLSDHHFTTDNWWSMEFDSFGLSVKDLSIRNMIARCNSSGPLYTMYLLSHPAPSSPTPAPLALVASTSTWHRRLGHLGVDVLSKLSHDYSVVCSRCSHDLCHTCQLGHYNHLPFVSSNSRADTNFDLIYYDLWTSPIVSISVYKYYLIILDDHSHFMWTFHFYTLSIFLLMSPYSLAAPSKLSNATMVVSSITPPLMHSSPPKGYFCGCLIPTLLRITVNPNASSAPLVICCAPCFFRLLFQLATGKKGSTPSHIY